MFSRKNKLLIGLLLFALVFTVGFFKLNLVQSSSGIYNSVPVFNSEVNEDTKELEGISTINDNAFIKIFKQGYGFDFVLNINGKEKTFSLKLPWKK